MWLIPLHLTAGFRPLTVSISNSLTLQPVTADDLQPFKVSWFLPTGEVFLSTVAVCCSRGFSEFSSECTKCFKGDLAPKKKVD